MRCTGRLRRLSEAEFHMKHPIILDGNHHVVRLLLKSLHDEHHHQGVENMRALVQQRFAVISGRSVIRSLQSSCVTCRRFRAKATEPLMADLPTDGGFPRFRKSAVHIHWRRLFWTTLRHRPQIYRKKMGISLYLHDHSSCAH